jgi:hypothetical protein
MAGSNTTTVTVKDGSRASSVNFTWTIGATGTGNTVTVTNPGAQAGTDGTAASLQIHASDSATGQTLNYTASTAPRCVLADLLLLLGVHADHRVAGGQVLLRRRVDLPPDTPETQVKKGRVPARQRTHGHASPDSPRRYASMKCPICGMGLVTKGIALGQASNSVA